MTTNSSESAAASVGPDDTQTLWMLLSAAGNVDDESERARLIATGIPTLIPCQLSGLALIDGDASGWHLALQRDGRQLDGASVGLDRPMLDQLLEHALTHGSQYVRAADATHTKPTTDTLRTLGLNSLAVYPVRTLRDRLGLLLAGGGAVDAIGERDQFVMRTLAENLATVLDNARVQQSLETRSRDLERRNDVILHAAGEGIVGVDTEARITFANAAAARMLGYTIEELTGATVDLLKRARPGGTDGPSPDCPIVATCRSGRARHVKHDVFWRRDGTDIPVEYTSSPIHEGNRTDGAVVVFRDITERLQAEHERERAYEEIRRLKDELERERDYLREEVDEALNFGDIVGESAATRDVLVRLQTVAPTPVSVLILGESGVGKELVARAIHRRSDRAEGPLVKTNCASIARDLFENEFFGHIKGAFTGAHRDRVGRFELADRGTLFLDEVAEIPLELQGKLLRVLQEGEFERIGEERTRRADVRVIAATNRDLAAEVEAGRFRRDLYYRLNVFPIELAPLRDRREDIPPLAMHFISAAADKLGRRPARLSRANLDALCAYDWPGNARELQNVIERAMLVSRDGRLRFDLPAARSEPPAVAGNDSRSDGTEPPLTEVERREQHRRGIILALERAGGRIYGPGGAAELMGLKPTTLRSRMKSLGIEKPRRERYDQGIPERAYSLAKTPRR